MARLFDEQTQIHLVYSGKLSERLIPKQQGGSIEFFAPMKPMIRSILKENGSSWLVGGKHT